MKKPLTALAIIVLMAAFAASARAEDPGAPKNQSAPGMPEMGAPQQMKQMSYMIGDWKTAMKYKLDPSQPVWSEAGGTCHFEYILDSCGIMGHASSDMGPMKLNGIQITSFNRETGKFQTYWLDNMFGIPSFYDGAQDSTGTLVFTGTDRFLGKVYHSRVTQKTPDKSTIIMEFDQSPDGKTYSRSMEIVYTRQ